MGGSQIQAIRLLWGYAERMGGFLSLAGGHVIWAYVQDRLCLRGFARVCAANEVLIGSGEEQSDEESVEVRRTAGRASGRSADGEAGRWPTWCIDFA